jgi:bifunctional DNA-binding transcriptional regulator/antitoxin component of YhaV-PrlF toxin-antitoxin module
MEKIIKVYHRFRSELINIPISIAKAFGLKELSNVKIEYVEKDGKQLIIISKL